MYQKSTRSLSKVKSVVFKLLPKLFVRLIVDFLLKNIKSESVMQANQVLFLNKGKQTILRPFHVDSQPC